jgi:hypothetical protein
MIKCVIDWRACFLNRQEEKKYQHTPYTWSKVKGVEEKW